MITSFGVVALPSSIAILAVLVLIIVFVPALGALIASRLHDIDDTPLRKRARYARTMLILWTMTALAYYALLLHGETIADVGIRVPHSWVWYVAGPAAVTAVIALLPKPRGQINEEYARRIALVVPASTGEWLWFLPVAFTAAVCEEFLYRGYALTQIAALTGNVEAGVVLSSLAFGLGHAYQGRTAMIGIAVLGLLYSSLFLLSGSLVPCMISHFVQDIVGAAIVSRRLAQGPNESR